MPHVTWSRPALSDLARLTAFLAVKNPSAAKRASRLIRNTVQRLRAFPESGQRFSERYLNRRKWTVRFGKSAYLVYYEYHGREITILSVLHGREDRARHERS